ncbi:MAG: N-6 DNA methylase, partial [Microvirga sp.]
MRAPLETLAHDLSILAGLPAGTVQLVGESTLAHLNTRPDYAVVVRNALVGFIEVKAPGKGADPRRFKDPHDKAQWSKLKSLPNLIYTDGNSFSLWRDGEIVGSVVNLDGDVETSGAILLAPPGLLALFNDFLTWKPVSPRTAKQLAEVSARLCRLLRDEVIEQLEIGSEGLKGLAADWRMLLFPEATTAQFADGYAQAVTFGLLVAKARDLSLSEGIDRVAQELRQTNSLIGTALRLLTDDQDNQIVLKTSIGTLTRVLDVVNWPQVSKGNPDAWLYFYEDFLEVYDNELRKRTGSYYTPAGVVGAMTRLVDEALRKQDLFDRPLGLASADVTVADPAVGTGTFLLGVLRQIAATVEEDQGAGAVPAAIAAAAHRLIGFELQFGPFAVAQLRLLAEMQALMAQSQGTSTHIPELRLFITDTLGNPFVEEEKLPQILQPIARSRRDANAVKRSQPITVVIGNPPYKEKAKGRGGWIEAGSNGREAPLNRWMPPASWEVGAHAKHLKNLYIYFWRWATWKVFGTGLLTSTGMEESDKAGIVCFITVAGFLNGPGFEKMRDDLRRSCHDIWVIDCSPEGHQPEVATRIFQGVQQPVCIVLAARAANKDPEVGARVHFHALPEGRREGKFTALAGLSLEGPDWIDCPNDWRAPFLPAATGAWADFAPLEDLFVYNGSGVMPGRTWVIAPD